MVLESIEKVFFLLFGFGLVFYIGLVVEAKELLPFLKTKVTLLLGPFYQFGLSPLLAFGLGNILNLEGLIFQGFLLLSMTPCGSVPNSLTILAKGNKELSVAITIVNSVLGLIFIPILAKVYLKEDGEVTLPILNMFGNLVGLVFCIAGGVIIKEKMPSFVGLLKKTMGFILSLSILGILIFSGKKILILFYKAPFENFIAAFILPLALYIGCFLLSLFLKRSNGDSKALALGSGTFNSPLTIVLILGSYPLGVSGEVLKIPLLYTPLILIVGALTAFSFSFISSRQVKQSGNI
tara:strand:- start:212 stop:1093 length:882 start_codon:yes stop_codon:yes gene_type:complete